MDFREQHDPSEALMVFLQDAEVRHMPESTTVATALRDHIGLRRKDIVAKSYD